MISYEVRRYALGIMVVGPIPLDEVAALCKAWKEQGLDWCDAAIAQHFKASFCVCSKANSDKWRAELGLNREGKEAKGVTLSFGA